MFISTLLRGSFSRLIFCTSKMRVEEVLMNRMDRPSVTAMDRRGVYEMDELTKCQKKIIRFVGQVLECVIKLHQFQWHFLYFALFLFIQFIDTSSIHFCDTWYVHLFHRHFLYYVICCFACRICISISIRTFLMMLEQNRTLSGQTKPIRAI